MLVRRIARPLFASWFIVEGMDAVRHPTAHAGAAREGLEALRRRTAGRPPLAGVRNALDLPLTDRQLALVVQAHGAATALAAGCLALGRSPRAAGLALAVLTAPLAVASLPAGKVHDEADAARRRRFWSSVSALGGALLAAGDTAGQPSVAWRVHAAREARAAAREA